MTGAMYAAIAGLKTHMSKMNVIGNNIANVNTNGYKSQRTVFKDAMYTLYSGGSDGTDIVGSMSPSQIGYGSQISSIDLNMGTGSYAPGRSTDCMIYGDGFFLVGDKDVADYIDPEDPESLKALTLTRVGDFEFGADGYLCDGSGNPVYGFLSMGTKMATDGSTIPNVSDQLVPIRLPKIQQVGDTYVVCYPELNEDTYKLEDYVPEEDADGNVAELPFVQLDGISIDPKTGAITGTVKETEEVITIGYLAIGNVTNPNGVTHEDGFYYKCGDGAGDLQVSLLGGMAETLGLTYINASLLDAQNNGAGGDDVTLPDKMLVGSAGGTNLMTGGLEGSNVDLATEISEMITTQRGYQANTRIITVTDTMLEELVNMKR